MDSDAKALSKGCVVAIAGTILVFVLLVGLSFATGWLGILYTNTFGVAQQNANTRVIRCSNEYLTTSEDKIRANLTGIANDDVEIANLEKDPSNAALVQQLKNQQLTDANAVYTALDHFSCQKSQLYADMGSELQPFFDRWNGPTGHSYTTVNP